MTVKFSLRLFGPLFGTCCLKQKSILTRQRLEWHSSWMPAWAGDESLTNNSSLNQSTSHLLKFRIKSVLERERSELAFKMKAAASTGAGLRKVVGDNVKSPLCCEAHWAAWGQTLSCSLNYFTRLSRGRSVCSVQYKLEQTGTFSFEAAFVMSQTHGNECALNELTILDEAQHRQKPVFQLGPAVTWQSALLCIPKLWSLTVTFGTSFPNMIEGIAYHRT